MLTSEADLDATGGAAALRDISRTGNKVIVARGFDTNRVLVSAGCIEKGEVIGDNEANKGLAREYRKRYEYPTS